VVFRKVPRRRLHVPRRIHGFRYLLPNSFTAGSMMLGLISIFYTMDGKQELAAWIILWCAILDKLDGIVARLVNATSEFGVEFDSFADFTAFGLAPGFLVYHHVLAQAPSLPFLPLALTPDSGLMWFYRLSAAFYILCAGIRLAIFNVKTADLGPSWFRGFPSTYCGAVLAVLLLAAQKYGVLSQVIPWMPLVIGLLGVAMLSPLKLPKIKGHKSLYMNLFQGTAGAVLLLFALLRMFPELLLAAGAGYLVVGAIAGAVDTARQRRLGPATAGAVEGSGSKALGSD